MNEWHEVERVEPDNVKFKSYLWSVIFVADFASQLRLHCLWIRELGS